MKQTSVRRWVQRSLHVKVAAGVICTVVLLSALYLAWDYYSYRRQLWAELQASAERISDVTMNSLLELAMVGRHPELLQGGVERLSSSSPTLVSIQVIDPGGKVRFASDRSLLGKSHGLQDPGCRECHRPGRTPPRSLFVELEGEDLVRFVSPVPNRKECHSCHDPARRFVGLLVIDHATGAAAQQLQSALLERLGRLGLMVVAILAVLGVLMNRWVIRPLQQLTAATGHIGKPGMAPPDLALAATGDEIGRLGQAFREMAERLAAYHRELEEKERARVSLLQRLVQNQEEERRQFSRELHDQLGQSLSALLLSLERSATDGNHCPEPLRKELQDRVRELLDEVHELAWRLRPSILDDFGLEKALERYVAELSRQTGIHFDFQTAGSAAKERLPGWLEVTLYRVAQEALTNVVRHSRATRCDVVLVGDEQGVSLVVEDDGVGFDPAAVQADSRRGLGLLGMEERVRECGGVLAIESRIRGGTTIRARIPREAVTRWQSA
ncbi:MAG: hypothetical protein Kow00109_21070 [Acidobacteriota bacterium]